MNFQLVIYLNVKDIQNALSSYESIGASRNYLEEWVVTVSSQLNVLLSKRFPLHIYIKYHNSFAESSLMLAKN